ncbi:5428_t:CDS:2 [Paraglomus occultum]|uniref:5428_t:CDS:1 n=1 Tax=Paraglomus occultum TaxID=144539 RepID=A0A9N8ZQD9_9GLOM|nr:5428_t:CDS:2 [Paraglomus occultum]
MSRVKEIADISKEIIKKLEEAITQTVNARLFYEKYKSLLDEAKRIHEQKYIRLWDEIYKHEAATSQEQAQKGQGKGQDFEKWFYEELVKVFDGQDRITDVSKGQTGMGKRADFLQEVLTETEPKKVAGRIVYETKNTEK